MNTVLHLTYASSLTGLCEINSSFDAGILRIAYTGKNRNGSYLSKETFERCLKTIYNCPIVCRYDRESDSLGAHDVEIVRADDGTLSIVNTTDPVGVIPESAKVYWETVEEDDGTTHEYLCAEALLWKRQEAYQKIKRDGCAAQSMEITVKDGESVDGVYKIYDFEFTAFCLLGDAEPCFESAALEFSKQDFKQQFSQMMLEIKESFAKVTTSTEDDIHPQINSTEGGEKVLNEKMELAARFGIDVNTLDWSIEDYTLEELEQKFAECTAAAQDGQHEPAAVENAFALESDLRDELIRALEAETIQREWGECPRYWFVDYDPDARSVYCWDTLDWLLYGFTYDVNGDAVTIQNDSKKRKKFEIVDFDDGEQNSPMASVFAMMEEKIQSNTDLEAKFKTASDTIASMETELGELRQFKSDTEAAIANGKKDEVFANFGDLIGVEAFEELKNNRDHYDAATLEEKCYAIRGRNTVAKFSVDSVKAPKLKVEKTDIKNTPYGGLFEQYAAAQTK